MYAVSDNGARKRRRARAARSPWHRRRGQGILIAMRWVRRASVALLVSVAGVAAGCGASHTNGFKPDGGSGSSSGGSGGGGDASGVPDVSVDVRSLCPSSDCDGDGYPPPAVPVR